MFDAFLVPALLSMGQLAGEGLPPVPVAAPPPLVAPVEGPLGLRLPEIQPRPALRLLPDRSLPTAAEPPAKAAALAEADKAAPPATVEVVAPLLPAPVVPPAAAAAAAAPAAAADRWWLMRELQGTAYGAALDDHRMYLYGWINGSVTGSTASQSNAPVTWNDRPNKFLLQQSWLRFGRSLVTSGTTEPTFGFHLDFLAGSDYRYTLPRGLWNSQFLNSSWDPATDPVGTDYMRMYGVDLVQHYVNAYIPNLFRGTEIRVGRFYTPWGVESIEAISTPLISHSYAFNWCPPFTHSGVAAYITFDPQWTAVLMAVNGNDVYFGDPAAEWRFVGNVKWTQPGGQNTVMLATSVGRGKFDAGEPFDVPGITAIDEAVGRNHINVFDVVWTHIFNSRLAYNLEAIYGYQTNVLGIFNEAGYGTAHWFALAHYLFWTISPQLTGVARFETFDDLQGGRTSFDTVYTALTTGLTYRPCKDVAVRSELRYDHASTGNPFDHGTKNQLFTAAVDFIVRW